MCGLRLGVRVRMKGVFTDNNPLFYPDNFFVWGPLPRKFWMKNVYFSDEIAIFEMGFWWLFDSFDRHESSVIFLQNNRKKRGMRAKYFWQKDEKIIVFLSFEIKKVIRADRLKIWKKKKKILDLKMIMRGGCFSQKFEKKIAIYYPHLCEKKKSKLSWGGSFSSNLCGAIFINRPSLKDRNWRSYQEQKVPPWHVCFELKSQESVYKRWKNLIFRNTSIATNYGKSVSVSNETKRPTYL